MSWLAPVLCFSLIFLSLKKSLNSLLGWRGSFLLAALIWGILVVVGTEVLSLFQAISYGYVLGFWLLNSLIAGVIFWKSQSQEKGFTFPSLPHFLMMDYVLLGSLIFIILLVGLIAWIAPPNNWDAMTYHMGRVVHWAQNHTVAHYPTHIMRQLWKAPWAEFAITHFYILNGNDQLANFIQWFSLLGSLIGISLIAQQLGMNRRGQLITALIAAALPMGILQGSGTQNDYVTAFWLICFINFFLFLESPASKNAPAKLIFVPVFALGASLGLGILTKEITYIYALPFFVWFLLTIFKKHKRNGLKYFFLIVFLVILLNSGHYQRNYDLYKKILAPTPDAVDLRTETWTPASLLSNTIRSVGLQLSTPFPTLNTWTDQGVEYLHTLFHLNLTDPRTTFSEYKFQIANNPFHEDNAGNAVYMILLLGCVGIFFAQRFFAKKYAQQREYQKITKYFMAVTAAFLLFSLLFKWQPWSSRLLLSLNILYAPFVVLILLRSKKENAAIAASILLFLLSLPWIFYNEPRPLLGKKNIFIIGRPQQYFANNFGFGYSYQQAIKEIESHHCSEIGLFWSENSWEYPLWALLKDWPKIRIEHINVQNTSARLSYPLGPFQPCAIIDDNSVEGYKILVDKTVYVRSRMLAHLSVFLPDPAGTFAKKSLLYHFQKMLQYSQRAMILHDQARKKIMLEPQELETIMDLKKEELKEAKSLDPQELDNIYPALGTQVNNLKNGLTLMLEGYKTADKVKYKTGQKLFFEWNIWFNQHRGAIEKNFKKLL